MQLGGAPKCVKCGKAAYFTEQVHGPGGVYHKSCLTCTTCSKRLETSTLNENSGNLYCKSCYQKAFGPVGYGNGIFQTVNSTSPIATTAPTSTSSRSSLENIGSPSVPSQAPKKFSIPAGNVCPSCSKTVYFAEQVNA